MSRISFHRPALAVPPTVPGQPFTLPTVPQHQNGGSGSAVKSLLQLLPLMSTAAMAACLISTGKPVLIIVGLTFMLILLGASLLAGHQIVRAPGRGALIRRSNPPTPIQVADTDSDGR
jgi:S-DNA-T family DNA segregation ATPase FtsK/SpoIIIE